MNNSLRPLLQNLKCLTMTLKSKFYCFFQHKLLVYFSTNKGWNWYSYNTNKFKAKMAIVRFSFQYRFIFLIKLSLPFVQKLMLNDFISFFFRFYVRYFFQDLEDHSSHTSSLTFVTISIAILLSQPMPV